MKIGVAIIGLGYMGSIFSRMIGDLGDKDCELIGVADTNPDVLKRITAEVGCSGFDDYRKLVEDKRTNLVYIATPPATHLAMIQTCVDLKKHILCEKPLVPNLEELSEVEKILAKNDVLFQIGLSQRYNAIVSSIKEIILSGALGKVEYMRQNGRFTVDEFHSDKGKWLYDNTVGGGTILESSVHYWDMVMWLTGARVREVYSRAHTRPYRNGSYDYISTAIGQLENGTLVNMDNIFSMPDNFMVDRRMEIIGQKGAIYINQATGPMLVCADEGVRTNFLGAAKGAPTFPDLFNGGGDIGSYRRELVAFIDCIRQGKAPEADFSAAKRVTIVTQAVLHSARIGQPVTIEYGDER